MVKATTKGTAADDHHEEEEKAHKKDKDIMVWLDKTDDKEYRLSFEHVSLPPRQMGCCCGERVRLAKGVRGLRGSCSALQAHAMYRHGQHTLRLSPYAKPYADGN
eukprot:2574202-Rhodomonas_salina.4